MTAACTVTASFSQNSYVVTATAGANGSISPASRTVLHGDTTTFTVTPDTNYRTASVSGCGGALSGDIYTTGIITEACTVSASFEFDPAVVTATQTSTSYRPGTSLTVTNQLNDTSGATQLSLVWTPSLPAGWTLQSASGDGSPEVSQSGTEILFTGSLGSLPIDFSYQVAVPATASGEYNISAVAEYQNASMINPISVSAEPNPLGVQQVTYHSADYRDTRWQVDSTEASRVLAYWRASAYHVDAEGADGYAPGSGSTDGSLHSADYRATEWQIDSSEASRVLAYWRAGAYHVDPAGADGYAPGAGTAAAAASTAATGLTATQAASGFTPGTTLSIRNSFDPAEAGSLLSLLWTPTLPAGWTLDNASGDGAPEVSPDGTQILFTGSLSTLPIEFTYQVSVPADSCDPVDIRAEAEYQAGTMVNPAVQSVAPEPLTLSPVDGEHPVLEDRTVTGEASESASGSITAGRNYIITSTGNVTFTAGQQIRLQPGFRVQTGGQFRAVIDPSLATQALASVCATRQTAAIDTAPANAAGTDANALEDAAIIAPRAQRLTWSALPAGLQAHLLAHEATVHDAQQDAAGESIVFATVAALLADDDNVHSDIYHYAVPDDRLELISYGLDGQAGNAPSDQPRLHGDGQQLVYRSTATNLVAGAQNAFAQLYQYDLGLMTLRRLTTTAFDGPVAGDTGQALVAGDWAIFRTDAEDLHPAGPGLYRQHLYHGTREPVGLDAWGQQDPDAHRPAADGAGSEIVYQRPEDDASVHIYLTDTVQAERLSLLSDPALGQLTHCCAAISPDGAYFAYREQGEEGDAWLHVCNRSQCNYERQPWPDDAAIQDVAPQFSDDGAELWWIAPEQGPGLPEVLHKAQNGLLMPVGAW
ncbi:3-coathanger stack domain-containing protein [Thiohalocapsa marina]|uniref:3-coathanger stack domain-containing protein n=1 Tax=Thiohalocapsa marina TaxID=424902 RepID=UPI0036DBCBB1